MTNEVKTRIEKEALDYAKAMISAPDDIRMFKYTIEDYIAGATAEQERFELWKNKLLANIIALPTVYIGTTLIDKKEVLKLIDLDKNKKL